MNALTIHGGNAGPATMSSREIAELTGKRRHAVNVRWLELEAQAAKSALNPANLPRRVEKETFRCFRKNQPSNPKNNHQRNLRITQKHSGRAASKVPMPSDDVTAGLLFFASVQGGNNNQAVPLPEVVDADGFRAGTVVGDSSQWRK